jgi:hypothetical protein
MLSQKKVWFHTWQRQAAGVSAGVIAGVGEWGGRDKAELKQHGVCD